MKRIFVCIIASGLLIAGTAKADVKDDIAAAYARADFQTTLTLTRPLAEQGDAPSQTMLGILYFYGQGVERDLNEAENWLEKAVAQGNPNAPAYLAATKQAQQDELRCSSYGATRGTPGFNTCFNDLNAIRTNIVKLQTQLQQQQQVADKAIQEAKAAAPKPKKSGIFGIIGELNGTADYAPSPNAGLGGSPAGGVGGNPATTPGFFVGEQTSGFNKICFYDRLGSREAVTIASTQLCPLQHN